MMLANLNIKTF